MERFQNVLEARLPRSVPLATCLESSGGGVREVLLHCIRHIRSWRPEWDHGPSNASAGAGATTSFSPTTSACHTGQHKASHTLGPSIRLHMTKPLRKEPLGALLKLVPQASIPFSNNQDGPMFIQNACHSFQIWTLHGIRGLFGFRFETNVLNNRQDNPPDAAHEIAGRLGQTKLYLQCAIRKSSNVRLVFTGVLNSGTGKWSLDR